MKSLSELKNMDQNQCLSPELIYQYFNKELKDEETIRQIEDHLDYCPICLATFEELQKNYAAEISLPENYDDIKSEMSKEFSAYLDKATVETPGEISKDSFLYRLKSWFDDFVSVPKLVYAVSAIAVILVCMYSLAYFYRSEYFKLAHINIENKSGYRSSTAPDYLTEGIELFNAGKFNQAIENFNLFMQNEPENYTVNYYAGLAHLLNSEMKLLGMPYKYNADEVNEGIAYLQKAIQLSDNNQFYQENCYWYMGKAYLMLDDLKNSRLQLQRILELNRTNLLRKEAAGELLQSIN